MGRKCWKHGRSSPSSQIMGPDLSLPWSCQFHRGVMMTSPRRMAMRLPCTAVNPPSPSMMNRIANAVCRCAGAVSPGMTSWSPRVEGDGREGRVAAGVGEHQDAALRLGLWDERPGLEEAGPDVGVPPSVRRAAGVGLWRDEAGHLEP